MENLKGEGKKMGSEALIQGDSLISFPKGQEIDKPNFISAQELLI